MAVKARLRLGDILKKEGLVNDTQLEQAIALQKSGGKRLGEALIELKVVTEEQVAEVLGRQLGIPCRHAEGGGLTPTGATVKSIIPEAVVRKELALPLEKKQNVLTIALTDPLDLILIDNLKKRTGCRIDPVITTRSELASAIETAYGKVDLLKEAVAGTYGEQVEGAAPSKDQVETLEEEDETLSVEDLTKEAGQAQVIRLVDLFLMEAINSGTSDIHVEPYPNRISLRFRIDGALQEVSPPAAHLMPAIISRVKIMSKMDIAEKRLPQDGGFTVKLGERQVDLRVSTIPVVYGEKVVIRLLDKSTLVTDFSALGIEGKALKDVEKGIRTPHGLIFVTGPTGSGKSTTLYALLSKLKDPSKNLLSIEDPVEYKVDGVNQVQAKAQIGLTFAAGLRAFLRQDPDIIMVGEVRDIETAEICVRAALTGHLVLSTLHTNDAPSAVTRLIDLGIEPFLLSPSIVIVIAQRLIRKLCPKCKEPVPEAELPKEKGILPPGQYFKPKGCKACRKIGFKGRIGIYEVIPVNQAIRDLINRRAPVTEIREVAQKLGSKTLSESGLDKAAQGITSLEEVWSITVGE